MELVIGLMSKNRELVEDFQQNLPDKTIRIFNNIDSLRADEVSIISIDMDSFQGIDTVQFYLSKVRKKFKSLPILLLLRLKQLENLSFEWFYNDLVVYPFRKGELEVRINRILFNYTQTDDENLIYLGNLIINLKEYTVYLNKEKIDLTYKEFELLRFLAQNQGVVFTRKDLLSKIWGIDYIGGTRTVDVHIRRLRGKLGSEFNTIIDTVRNVGYRCLSITDKSSGQ